MPAWSLAAGGVGYPLGRGRRNEAAAAARQERRAAAAAAQAERRAAAAAARAERAAAAAAARAEQAAARAEQAAAAVAAAAVEQAPVADAYQGWVYDEMDFDGCGMCHDGTCPYCCDDCHGC